MGVSAEPRARKFCLAKVPTAAECECVLCTVKLMTTKDRWSLHNVANDDVLRYLVETVSASEDVKRVGKQAIAQ